MNDLRLIAAALAARRLERLEKATARKVREVWKEARADAEAVVRAYEKTPSRECP